MSDDLALPAVSLAKADSKQEINRVSNNLISTAKSAVWQALAAVILVSLLITALVFRLMKMLATSISQLQAGIESIGTGNLDSRLNPQTTDELGKLAATPALPKKTRLSIEIFPFCSILGLRS